MVVDLHSLLGDPPNPFISSVVRDALIDWPKRFRKHLAEAALTYPWVVEKYRPATTLSTISFHSFLVAASKCLTPEIARQVNLLIDETEVGNRHDREGAAV